MLVVAAIILLAGCASPRGPTEIVADGLADARDLAPRGFTEWNVRLAENASIDWSLEADVPVRWDLHSHPDDELLVHARGEGTRASGDFLAPAAGVYSLSALAGESQTRVRIEIRGDFEEVG